MRQITGWTENQFSRVVGCYQVFMGNTQYPEHTLESLLNFHYWWNSWNMEQPPEEPVSDSDEYHVDSIWVAAAFDSAFEELRYRGLLKEV